MAERCREGGGRPLSKRERPRGDKSRQTTFAMQAHCSTSIETEGAGKGKGSFPREHLGPWHGRG